MTPSPKDPIRVLIVDDHHVVRLGLRSLLSHTGGFRVVGEAGSVAEAVQMATQLTPDVLAKADKSAGRAVFNLACANCHRLYGQGGEVGPDLTGAGRDNLDYLLDNIADPSAVVSADFRMTVVNLKDGRTLNALIAAKTDRTLTLKTMTETLTVPRADVASLQESALSLMPEGLIDGWKPQQVRDLFAYLRSTQPLVGEPPKPQKPQP